MVRITDFLHQSCIKMEIEASKKKETIFELLQTFQAAGLVQESQMEGIFAELLEREKLSSTGIGGGIAIPHKILTGFQTTIIAFGRKQKGIPFDSSDGQPVNLVFLILGKEGSEALHLRLLCKLARLLQRPSFREGLAQAESPEQILSLFQQEEVE